MKFKSLLFFSILSFTVMLSCKKEDEPNPTLQEELDNGVPITSLVNEYPLNSFYGKQYAGGYIYVINNNGTGSVCGLSDLSETMPWGCNSTGISGTEASVGSGAANTDSIVTQCSETLCAAYICANSAAGGYSDWYLPSQDELVQVYEKVHLNGVGGFATNYYWSSTQQGWSEAQHVLFNDGSVSFSTKSNLHYVRAVRDF